MLRIVLALTLATICYAATPAQKPNPQCPSISINTPPSIIAAGQTAEFNVVIEGFDASKLRFEWEARFGKIESGQGTPVITVRRTSPQGSGTYLALKIKGLPAGCPNSFYETAPDEYPPPARELEIFSVPLGRIEPERFQSIANAAYDHPNDQIVIFVPPDLQTQLAFVELLSKSALKKIADDKRISYLVNKDKDSQIKVWRVPPGSQMPKCDGCENDESCPLLTMVGPADVVVPNGTLIFEAKLTESPSFTPRFAWTVSDGTIIEGQGTRSIKVRAPDYSQSIDLTANVTVIGLPQGCVNIGSATYAVASQIYDPFIDAYGKLSLNEEKARMQNAATVLEMNPKSKILILKYFPKITAASRQRINQLTDFLIHYLRVPRNRFEICCTYQATD